MVVHSLAPIKKSEMTFSIINDKIRTQFLCSQQLQKNLGHPPQDISASSTHTSKNVQLKREMGDEEAMSV